MKGFHVFVIILLLKYSYGWDNEDLELFDLVEEVNKNFYEEFGIKSDAEVSEIRKAYRKLSLQHHPDKNKDPGAEEKFRQLVAIYEVLKDEERRKKYDNVVEFGLPDWRQPVYYYRKVRKLGLIEMSIILLFIFTIGHFLIIWAAYLEKKFEMEEVFNSRKKKDKRGRKAKLQQAQQEEEMEEELQRQLDALPRPRGADLLPFKMVRGLYRTITGIPGYIQEVRAEWERQKRRQRRREQEEQEQRELEEEAKLEREKRPKRKRVQIYYEVDPNEKTERPVSYTPVLSGEGEEEEVIQQNTEEWTNEDYKLLAKAVAKYPGGSSNRWDKIALMLNRDVNEVIRKSKAMKTDLNKPVDTAAQGITGTIGEAVQIKKGKAISSDISKRSDFVEDVSNTKKDSTASKTEKSSKKTSKEQQRTLTNTEAKNVSTVLPKSSPLEDIPCISTQSKPSNGKKVSFNSETQSISSEALSKSMKDKSGKVTVDSTDSVSSGGDGWSQNQQKIFEWGLTQYPRGVDDRWGKIADHIPGKTKEDCIVRFKFLAEVIKKKKQMQQ